MGLQYNRESRESMIAGARRALEGVSRIDLTTVSELGNAGDKLTDYSTVSY